MKYLALILFVALALRLTLFLAVGSWRSEVVETTILTNDAPGYFRLATNLVEHCSFSSSEAPPLEPDIRRTPLFPLFAATVFRACGPRPFAVILFHVLIGSFLCLATYGLGRIVFSRGVGVIAGLIHAAEYSSVIYNNTFLPETLFAACLVFHIGSVARFFKDTKTTGLVLSGVLLALSALCRPISVYFVVFLVPVFLVHFRSRLLFAVRSLAILALTFVVTISPWVARNYVRTGKPLLSIQQEYVLEWNFPALFRTEDPAPETGGSDHALPKSPQAEGTITSAKTETNSPSGSYLRDVASYIAGSMRFFAVVGSSSFTWILGLDSADARHDEAKAAPSRDWITIVREKNRFELSILALGIIFLLSLYSTGAYAVYRMIAQREFTTLTLLILTIGYFALAVGSIPSDERYRMPVMPYIILLSSYGVATLSTRFGRSRNSAPE